MSRWAAEKQQTTKLRVKERLDACAKPLKIAPGDYVYVKKEIRTHKFEKFYEAPLKVLEVTSNNNAILELPDKRKIVKHFNKLKKAYVNSSNTDQFSE